MTLPSSGTLYLSQIQSEFGGSNPAYLSEYYGAASGVPSSGTIYISHFYGKSNVIREPASGYNYRLSTGSGYKPMAGDYYYGAGFDFWDTSRLVWNGATIWSTNDYYPQFTQVNVGGWTYVKGPLAQTIDDQSIANCYVYRVYRWKNG